MEYYRITTTSEGKIHLGQHKPMDVGEWLNVVCGKVRVQAWSGAIEASRLIHSDPFNKYCKDCLDVLKKQGVVSTFNLYRILVKASGPKSSREGVFCYLAARNDEEVYCWLKSDPRLYQVSPDASEDQSREKGYVLTGWSDIEREEENEGPQGEIELDLGEYRECSWREQVLHYRGDYERAYDDYYYGVTNFRWELLVEGCSEEKLQVLKECLKEDVVLTLLESKDEAKEE